jgi:glycine hydroxymethyltransferase
MRAAVPILGVDHRFSRVWRCHMSHALAPRPWLPAHVEDRVASVAATVSGKDVADVQVELDRLVQENRVIHEVESVNLNPATNVMNPRAEAMLSANLGSRPSLGYPGDKYEMGLEAIEQIEVIADELVAEVFGARFVESRVASGAMSNLYAFMATCRPGDTIIVPPASIGGHVTHQEPGAAGLYGLNIVPAPVDADGYTVDVAALRALAEQVRPKLITIGSSLNLWPHPVAAIREVADAVGAKVLFDAAHLCGLIAGGAWPNPLDEGAHLLTMSTYKSLGGPPSGLVLTNEPDLAERLEAIAFPGLTANFDSAKSAAMAVTMLDWKAAGADYAAAMVETAQRLAQELVQLGVPVYAADRGCTTSHQFAVLAAGYGGGQTAAQRLRQANLLACGIGLPVADVDGDMNGLRIGTPELVRRGMTAEHMPELAALIARALDAGTEDLPALAKEVSGWRARFTGLHYLAPTAG